MVEISRKDVTKWYLFFQYVYIVIAFINGIVIVPFYLHFIDNSLYGAWLASGSILVWLSLLDPGVGEVFQQRVAIAFGKSDKESLKNIISSGFFIGLIIFIICLIISYPLAIIIPNIIKYTDSIFIGELIFAFKISAIGTAFTMFAYPITGINTGLQGTKIIGLITVPIQLLSIIITLVLLYKGYGLLSIAYSVLFRGISYVIFDTFYLLWLINQNKIGYGFNFNFFISFSKIFSYTFFSKSITVIAENIDLILISRFINQESVIILEFTRRPIKLALNILRRISVAFMPAMAHLKGENNNEKIKHIFLRLINIVLWIGYLLFFGFICFNKNLIAIWIGNDLFIGNSINILLNIFFFIGGITYTISNITFSLGNIKGNSLISVLKGILTISLMVVLGYLLDIWGIIIAPLIALILSEAWYYPLKISKMISLGPRDFYKIGKEGILIIGCSIVITLGLFYLKMNNWTILIFSAILFTVLYFLCLYLISSSFRTEFNYVFITIKRKLLK